jgi:hypothetical protein
VYLRIRPVPDRCKAVPRPVPGNGKDPRRRPKQAAGGELCLVPTGANSVALTVPQAKLVDPKRGRTEVFDGFSAVFPPDSTQVRCSAVPLPCSFFFSNLRFPPTCIPLPKMHFHNPSTANSLHTAYLHL